MNIGVFDSGLGGLIILKALVKALPKYDYIYLGDTQRVPYGNRSPEAIYKFLEEAVDYLFKQNCGLIIVACNTASAEALRKIQQEYLPCHYPKRRVLGIIIPTIEEALKDKNIKRIGILATQGAVNSGAYIREIKKANPNIKVYQQAAPLLVPLIENDGIKWSKPIIEEYLRPLLQKKVDAIILGCTHYPILKRKIRKASGVKVISQDEIISHKLESYLKRHFEIDEQLSKKGTTKLLITDLTKSISAESRKWFGKEAVPIKVVLKEFFPKGNLPI